MTLCWVLNPKIKDGYLGEYKELIVKLNILKDSIEIFKLKTRLKELVIYPQEVAQCKRIGIDEEATEFFRNKLLLESKGFKTLDSKDFKPLDSKESFESVILSYHGKYVENLVPLYNKDAIAEYSLPGESCLYFNGTTISNNYTIPYILRDEAFQDHSSTEMLEYSNKLVEFLYENQEVDFVNSQILYAAIKWLRFWGSHGFSFRAKH
jgi:hypothetical protein